MSKAFFDVSFYDKGKAHYAGQFSNNRTGFKQMMKLLKAKTEHPLVDWFICFENTGPYSKALFYWLSAQSITCKEESALKISRSLGLRRGKDDKTDSKDICKYAFEKKESLEPSELPKPLILKLKKLLSRRDFLVRHRTALKVSIKESKGVMDPELFEFLTEQNKALILLYDQQIKKIEARQKELIAGEDEVKKNFDLINSVIGIGPITSAYLIAVTANFSCFKNARKFASYSGIAPFPHSSGTWQGKTKVSHLANKKIKSILSNGVQAAIKHDKQIQQYYQKKLAEGKPKGSIFNAIKNKLIQRVFSVIKRQTKYVPLGNYA